MDDPLTVLLADAPEQSLVNLLVQLDSARSAMRRECLNFLNKTPPYRRARKSRLTVNEYASTSEVVREALRDWSFKRQLMLDQLTALKQDIDKGLADVAAGRTRKFDAQRIAERGRKLLAARST